MNNYILFLVKTPLTPEVDDVVIVRARDREDAKRQSIPFLGQYADKYIVTPLTREDDRVRVAIDYTI